MQQKQVNWFMQGTKARYFGNFASTKKYVTRGRGFDQFFSVRNAVNSKQIILTVFNTKQKSLFAYKYLQISLLLRKEVHTFLLSTDLLLPQTLDILLVDHERRGIVVCIEYQSVCPFVGIGSPHPLTRKRVCLPPLDPRGEGGVTQF
jgi:hypothetical protein